MRLFLDDIRTPLDSDFDLVRNYDEFVQWIQEKDLPTLISFDHDLGEGKTGYDCALFLVNYCLDHQMPLPEFKVHSQNPVGKENIERLLDNFKKFNSK